MALKLKSFTCGPPQVSGMMKVSIFNPIFSSPLPSTGASATPAKIPFLLPPEDSDAVLLESQDDDELPPSVAGGPSHAPGGISHR